MSAIIENTLERLLSADRSIFKEMVADEMFYIDTEFAHSSDLEIKEAIKESVDELSRGFPQITKAEIRSYMIEKWGEKREVSKF